MWLLLVFPISFSLPQSENISVKIFDISGRLIATLADKILDKGETEITWDASEVNAGIYFLQSLKEAVKKTLETANLTGHVNKEQPDFSALSPLGKHNIEQIQIISSSENI